MYEYIDSAYTVAEGAHYCTEIGNFIPWKFNSLAIPCADINCDRNGMVKSMHVLFSRLMLYALLVYAVVGCVQPTSARAEGARAIPDDNLAYPVLITLGNSTGSGFYVN